MRRGRIRCPDPGVICAGPMRAAICPSGAERRKPARSYAALDLGTNNCRLLIAEPAHFGFRVVDAFSRIVRLGEGLGHGNVLGAEAIDRTIDALRVCRDKMDAKDVCARAPRRNRGLPPRRATARLSSSACARSLG